MSDSFPPATLSAVATRRTLRLRTRVTLFFAFIALLAGIVLIGVTYGFARNNLINERTTTAKSQAFKNANDVRDVMTTDPEEIGDYIENDLRTESGGFAVLSSSAEDEVRSDLTRPLTEFPQRLVDTVWAGRSAIEFTSIDGDDFVTVGVAIAEQDTGYFEAFPLRSTERTLTSILTALTLGAAGTLLLATLFGLATSRRLLRPLSQVADAAEDIASGGLDTRLAPESDPDLDRLAGSFNEMADAVQARIEREARFASDVSHELRSPITALAAAVEVLDARRDDIPERTQQALDVVVSQIRRFDDMVMDLLELSRLDAGSHDLNVERLDIMELSQRIATRYNAGDVPIDVGAAARPGGQRSTRCATNVSSATCSTTPTTTATVRRGSNCSSSSRTASASPWRTTDPGWPRANAAGSSSVSPAAARPAAGWAPGSVWRSSPSTARRWGAGRGSRTVRAAELASSSSCRRRSVRSGWVRDRSIGAGSFGERSVREAPSAARRRRPARARRVARGVRDPDG